jgi:serine/threonine protein kinase
MTTDSGRAIEIFTEAVQLPKEDRVSFLNRACGENHNLRQKIEALLRSNDRAEGFLEQPAATIGDGRARAVPGEKPGDLIDRYRLLQKIGEGGCGVVFVAQQQEPVQRRVALKVVKPGMDTKIVIARFGAERQALALMDHPNIAHVFDAGATEGGRPYFVMELVEGLKITDYCDRQSLPIPSRLELFVQVCDAIQHAHQKGIIHRDIKPSNVLVATRPDGKPALKVIDFGIAKATAGHQLTDKTIFTLGEMVIGTPAYMSPEQAALTSTDVDTRTDIYSLGVLLYELLTGTTPFDTRELLKAGFDEVRRVIRDEEPARPSTRLSTMIVADLANVPRGYGTEALKLVRELRGDLDWIAMKALEKDRTRRYATAHGLALDVQRYLSGEPVLARPPSATYRFRKLAGRNKLLFSGVTLVFVMLVISLITTARWLMIERGARERMRHQMEIGRLDEAAWELFYQAKYADAEQLLLKSFALRRQFPNAEVTTPLLRHVIVVQTFAAQQKFDKIKPFLDEFVDPSLLTRAGYRQQFGAAIDTLIHHRRWADADALAEKLRNAFPTDSSLYHMRAPLLVANNDLDGYRLLCGQIVSRFSNSTDPYVADKMAKDCLILPSSAVDLKPVAALADVAVGRGANEGAAPWFRCCKALAEYRLGHYEEAVNWGRLAAEGSAPPCQAEACAIMAMARFKMNQSDQARIALAGCETVIKEKLPKLEQDDPGEDWRDLIIANALRSEAKRMVDGEPSPAAHPANLPH